MVKPSLSTAKPTSRDGLKSGQITGIRCSCRGMVQNLKILTMVKSCRVNPPTISALYI